MVLKVLYKDPLLLAFWLFTDVCRIDDENEEEENQDIVKSFMKSRE